ncbi:hypothetical protein EV122DRAFT_178518, partial [Schizophyllum commune]
DFFPEFDHVAQLSSTASNITGHCRSLAYILWYAHGETQNIQPIRDAMRAVADYMDLVKAAISALEMVFRTIQRTILSSHEFESSDEALSNLTISYRSALTALRNAGSATERTLETLSTSERDAHASIAYPPVIHFFLVEVIGTQYNDRLYALAKLPHFVQRVKDDVGCIASAAVHLQLSVEGLQERFSIAKMLEYRDLGPEGQWQVKQFLSRSWIALNDWADHIGFCGEDFFPEFDHVTELGGAATAIYNHCRSLVHLLWYAHDGKQNIEPIRNAMRFVAHYMELLKGAISALVDVFGTIRSIIATPSEAPDQAISGLSASYLSTLAAFKGVDAATENTLDTLTTSERDAFTSIAYPPVIHFLLVNIVGSQRNDRVYALEKLPHFVQRVKEDVNRIASATVQLQLAIEGLQKRFSVSKMLEYRDLTPEQQWQVKQFLSRTCVALETWVGHISLRGQWIRGYDKPVL